MVKSKIAFKEGEVSILCTINNVSEFCILHLFL